MRRFVHKTNFNNVVDELYIRYLDKSVVYPEFLDKSTLKRLGFYEFISKPIPRLKDYEIAIESSRTLEDDIVYQNWSVIRKELSDYKEEKLANCKSLRNSKEQEGFLWNFGIGEDVVQIRDLEDKTNINALVTQALVIKTVGDEQMSSAPLFKFRAQSNETYSLTADEMIFLGTATFKYCSDIYYKYWELKEYITNAKTHEEIENINSLDFVIPGEEE